jgi:hypothetical protein
MALADQSWYIESAFGTKRPQATRLAKSLLAATNPGGKALILSVARRPRQSHHNIVNFVEYRSRYRSASRFHQRQPTQ